MVSEYLRMFTFCTEKVSNIRTFNQTCQHIWLSCTQNKNSTRKKWSDLKNCQKSVVSEKYSAEIRVPCRVSNEALSLSSVHPGSVYRVPCRVSNEALSLSSVHPGSVYRVPCRVCNEALSLSSVHPGSCSHCVELEKSYFLPNPK